MAEVTRQILPVSAASSNAVGPVAREETFYVLSAGVFDLSTKKRTIPKESKGQCVCVLSVGNAEENAVLLLVPNPSQDYLDNWNTAKYRPCITVLGTEVCEGNQIPQVFSQLENFYEFTANRIIVASSISPADYHAVSFYDVCRNWRYEDRSDAATPVTQKKLSGPQ